MITIKNLKEVLDNLEFTSKGEVYTKKFESFDCLLKIDFKKKEIVYPENKGLKINERQTCNLKANENFVVLECVNRLLEQGYNPAHIELEPKWKVGHGASGGRADVLVRDNKGKSLLIIECKNAGTEFTKHWNETLENGSQLFGYAQQEKEASFLCLYASDFIDKKVKEDYRLITLIDNKQYLEDNPKLENFENAKVREDLYRVWKNTYQKHYTTKGLFEKDIQAYNIGKKKYTIEDLSLVDSYTKQSKHHAFATILRKYNVSGRENAFDKLVNLFLCKIVDEKNNPNDLQFYWKGIAYDTPFELQDRLQKLYQTGMNEFLKEDVTYIDNKQIDKAFWAFKNDPDATRETIKGYFKQLKFFTNNDFAFIDVHNERLFYENADVLIDIVRLFQDTKVKSDSKNQFLGDMFENFLDGGVKQSEGQFFTPMPITRFLIQSLPLESIISESQKIPKAIDYACGSGHFLNELASQMRPFIEANKEVSLEEYHKQIHGIEKEYRLSKVAKVSAFMYGQDNIEITYSDALAKKDKFKTNDYQILVANPPYSVKGFLGTLSQESKESYELINTLTSKQISTNNSIECFFIERAKQMLGSNGVAAIIVPSSILSNTDSTYVETRSILIKYFDIISIAEFGSGTFGKTGTNTITLFLRRKGNEPEQAIHYANRVNSWFGDDTKKQKVFDDQHFIESYCQHVEIEFEDYKTLLQGKLNENLLKAEMFEEYKIAFNKLTSVKNKKKQASFKKITKEEQQKELDNLFLKYLVEVEKEKLYYFVLASQNSSKVLISKVQKSTKKDNKQRTKEQNAFDKQFLGYEWSGAKENAGIKIFKDNKGNHITPLYDPNNRENKEKINYYIQNNFNSSNESIPENLKENIFYYDLINLINFKRTDFDRQITLNPKKENSLTTKWSKKPLSSLLKKVNGNLTKITNKEILEKGLHPVVTQETDTFISGYTNNKNIINDLPLIVFGDHSCTFKFIDFEFIRGADGTQLLKVDESEVLTKYLFYILSFSEIENREKYERHFKYLKNIKVPLPPKETQQKIINECQTIDQEKEKATQEIEKAKNEIENITKSIGDDFVSVRLSDISKSISSGLTPLRSNSKFWQNATIPWLKTEQLNEKNIFDTNEKISKIAYDETSIKLNKKNTLSIAMYGEGRTRGNVAILKNEMTTNQACCNVYLNSKKAYYEYVYYFLKTEYSNLRSLSSGVRNNLNTSHIKNYKISLPSLDIQNKIVEKILKIEMEISRLNEIIKNINERKEAVINKYL